MSTKRGDAARCGWILLAKWRKEGRFISFVVSLLIELTFGRCEDSKKVTCDFPGFQSREKHFWAVRQKRLDPEFWNNFLQIPNKECSINFPGFVTVTFSLRQSYIDPATQVHPLPQTMIFFWVHVRFLWHKTKQPKLRNSELYVFVEVSKRLLFRNFSRVILDCGTPTSLLKDEYRWKKCMTSFYLLQRPKGSSNITVPIRIWKTLFPGQIGKTSIPD